MLDNWSPMPLVDWEQGRYLEQIVHVRTYLEQLVLSASSPVAARAARMLLDHGPPPGSSLQAVRRRFPQPQERFPQPQEYES